MKTRFPKILLLFVLFLLVGCTARTEKLWLDAPDWGRAQLVETAGVRDPLSLALDGEGNLFFFTLAADGGATRPRVSARTRAAELLWTETLNFPISLPDQPEIVWDGERLHLFWISSYQLYTAQINAEGELLTEPRLLSREVDVDQYSVAAGPGGAIELWYAGTRRAPGLWTLEALDPERAVLVDEAGIRPSIRFDAGGTLHAAWTRYEAGGTDAEFYYAAYPAGSHDPGVDGQMILAPSVGVTSALRGPWFGLGGERAYLFWRIEINTGLSAGTAKTEYITFPLGRPQVQTEAQTLRLPRDFGLEYTETDSSDLVLGAWLPWGPGSASPQDLEPNPSFAGDLVVAARIAAEYELRKEAPQAILLIFDEGQPAGYQMLSFTRGASAAPAVISDDAGYLYGTWLEPAGDGVFYAYFASTAPDIRESLAAVNSQDLLNMAAETVFGMLTGIILAPFAGFLWLLLPLIIVGLTGFMRREVDGLIGKGTAVSILLAVAAFWAVKLATLGSITEYVPFSAWIPLIPTWMGLPLKLLVNGLILLGAAWAAWHYTFRRGTQSALYFILIYAGMDTVLTLAIYGIIVFGVI